MNNIFAQIILGARGDGIEGWMDILILVFFAVVYGLGAILKSKKKKEKEEAQKLSPQEPAQKPAKKGLIEQIVSEIQNAVKEAQQGQKQKPAVKPAPKTQVAVRKYAAEAKQVTQTKSAQPSKSKSTMPVPKRRSSFEKLPELGASIQGLPGRGERIGVVSEAAESKYLSDVLSDYANPEELRRAILHYEILGRPLALRDPSGQLIGL
ncbi:MAG: hypothetical protein PVH77_05585 [Phycisphaerales bacterium]|jgi:hypothetical protein